MANQLSDAQIAGVAKNAGFTGNDLVTAVAVCLAESGGVADEQSKPNNDGSIDYGLWQINSKAHAEKLAKYNWRDPQQNAAMARLVWKERGGSFSAWVAYKPVSGIGGTYGRFMGRAMIAAGHPATTLPVDLNLPPNATDAGLIDHIPGVGTVKEMLDKIWGAVQTILSGVQDVLNGVKSMTEFVGKLGEGIAWLGNVENWKRLALFGCGLALILLAIWRWSPGDEAVQAAKPIVEKGLMLAATKGAVK